MELRVIDNCANGTIFQCLRGKLVAIEIRAL
jgi:hypothetical protein